MILPWPSNLAKLYELELLNLIDDSPMCHTPITQFTQFTDAGLNLDTRSRLAEQRTARRLEEEGEEEPYTGVIV